LFCVVIFAVFLRGDVDAQTIRQNSQYGLIYFYEDGCPYCEKQTPVLNRYIKDYPMDILKIEIRHSPNIAAKFDVTLVPTIILVQRNSKNYLVLSKGAIDYYTLKNRISEGIKILQKQQIRQTVLAW